MTEPAPSAPRCKICDAQAAPFFKCDFHNQGQVHFGLYAEALQPSGLILDYYRCPDCGFIFSSFTDTWDAAGFATYIYNKDYPLIDGSYNGYRGGGLANILYLGFHDRLSELSILDYGGGVGISTALLSAFGAKKAATYDPFAAGAHKPGSKFNIVTCLEVLEHATDPKALAADLVSLANLDDGFLLMTTQFPPEDIAAQKENWWYVSPRVGHVSFYTQKALALLFAPYGLKFLHINDNTHLGFTRWPEWAERFMPKSRMGG